MFKKLAIASMVSIALYGCGAEERSYEAVPRAQEQITTQSLDTEALWLYMPSTGATPRYATSQRGFFQGTPKLVKLRFDKTNGIIAEEVDRDTIREGVDSRYTNVINQAPVLKIPGTFEEYRCAENNFDECTNKEELNEYLREMALSSTLSAQIDYTDSTEIVSTDLVGSRHPGVVDGVATIAQDNRAVLYIWYDNEFGYSCQVVHCMEQMMGVRYKTYPAV